MNELFNMTNCYTDTDYYYFYQDLNKDNKSNFSVYNNHTLKDLLKIVETKYGKDTSCLSLNVLTNVSLIYGSNDFIKKYIIVKIPKVILKQKKFKEIVKNINYYFNDDQKQILFKIYPKEKIKQEYDHFLNPQNFLDYANILKKLQEAGYDLNDIKFDSKLKVEKVNDSYKFTIIRKKLKKVGQVYVIDNKTEYNDPNLIKIGRKLYYYEKGKKYQFEESIDLNSEEIKTLRDIGLYVISEKNRDHILYPKNFEDYFNLLKKLQESGIDINSIIASDNLRIIKFNSIYKFEIIKKNVKKAKDDSNNTLNNLESNQVNIIKIGKKVTAFRKGKNSVATDSEPLSDDNLENLQSIGFNTPYLKRLEREINPKTFTDYFNLLKKLQNYGVDINKITSNDRVKVIKINNDFSFKIIKRIVKTDKQGQKITINSDEYYKEDLIPIGYKVVAFKKAKQGPDKDSPYLTEEEIKKLQSIGLEVIKERDIILNPKSFLDYMAILKKLQEDGYNLNDIYFTDKLKITKESNKYKLEIIKEDSKEYKIPGLMTIGQKLYCFKRGKYNNSPGSRNLNPDEIAILNTLGFKLAIEEKKSIDYIELLKRLKESGYDINKIKYYDKVKITKNNHEFKLEIINENDPLYNQPNLILIGPHVLSFKKGKKFQYSGPTDLSSDEITRLQSIGLVILTDHVLYPQSFNDYFIILKLLHESGYNIMDIKTTSRLKVTKEKDKYFFKIINKENQEWQNKDLIFIGRKVKSFESGKNSPGNHSSYLTVAEINNLLSIGFTFKKNIKDIIYKREICKTFNIDIKLNQEIIDRISKLELISKIKYLIKEKNMPILDNNGNLVDIFTMSSYDIEEKYGISLDTIISTYGYKQVKKLNLI